MNDPTAVVYRFYSRSAHAIARWLATACAAVYRRRSDWLPLPIAPPLYCRKHVSQITGRRYRIRLFRFRINNEELKNSGFEDDRQPEMALKTGNIYSAYLKLWETTLKVPWQIRGLRPCKARKTVGKWLQQRPTTGSRHMAAKTGNIYLWNFDTCQIASKFQRQIRYF